MTRLYRTDQELNSLTKVRQSHVLYSRFEPNPIRRVSTRRSHYFDSFYAIMNSTELSRFQRNLSFWS
jgi:hypothetical protein